jgi:hypothetical protein
LRVLRRVLGEVAILIGMGLTTGLSSAIERGWLRGKIHPPTEVINACHCKWLALIARLRYC